MGALTKFVILSFLALVSTATSRNLTAKPLVQLSSNCENGPWINCEEVTVDLTALRSNQPLILPNGAKVTIFEIYPGYEFRSITAVYQSGDLLNSLTITFFESGSDEVNAIIHEADRVFNLAPCDQTGSGCHVLAQGEPVVGNSTSYYTMRNLELMTKAALEELTDVEDQQEQGKFQQDPDGTYVATIKIYYTKQFAEVESNVNAFISNMIAQANTGFKNSRAQIRLRLLSTQEVNNITENQSASSILEQFRTLKGSSANLRGTADFAHLLVRETTSNICGVAYLGDTRLPFGVTKRDCAITNYVFGHEIGHNLGCYRERGQYNNAIHEYAFGYLILGTQYRTIMASWNTTHRSNLNLYSNPSVQFQNVSVGNALNNCARKIRENARTFASIGSDTDLFESTTVTTETVISTCVTLVYRFIPAGSSLVVQYPLSGNYANNKRCLWKFETIFGRQLRVKVENVDIEEEHQCRHDMLAVFFSTSGNKGFCNAGNYNDFTSQNNYIVLRFTSNGSVVRGGFRVVVQAM
ncbi:uncharacterized protein LOC131881995 [Tigriopus californicus]|uniref:uncharacterized protein LOC131881995 n=1 Tax=Tigriopus californicus TaxID=6832 RepID=UPI0027DA5B8A|nr:uncharacterized protein LOC131881995 [Tigriopus californicus]